jgi:hypothetical protein
MKRLLYLFAPACAWCLLANPAAWADPTPAPNAQWTYNFSPNPPGANTLNADSPGTGVVTFTNAGTSSPITGASDLVVSNIYTSSLALPSNPDKISGSNGNYGFSMVLTDSASGQSAILNFTGTLSGSFSGGDPKAGIGGNANLANLFTGGSGGNGATVSADGKTITFAPITLGANSYVVKIDSYTPPTAPPLSASDPPALPGAIGAHVDVFSATGGIAKVPEPSSLLLAGLGLTLAGAASWRRRRSLASVLA